MLFAFVLRGFFFLGNCKRISCVRRAYICAKVLVSSIVHFIVIFVELCVVVFSSFVRTVILPMVRLWFHFLQMHVHLCLFHSIFFFIYFLFLLFLALFLFLCLLWLNNMLNNYFRIILLPVKSARARSLSSIFVWRFVHLIVQFYDCYYCVACMQLGKVFSRS